MKIQEVLDVAKENGAVAIERVIEDLKQQIKIVEEDARTACDAYLSDVKEKERRINQRIEILRQQGSDIEQQIKSTQLGLATATIKGDTNAFKAIQGRLSDMEAERAAISTQITLLQTVVLPRNKELFDVVDAKGKMVDSANETLEENARAIYRFAEEQAKAWKKIADETISGVGYWRAKVPGYAKVIKHYFDLGNTVRKEPSESVKEVVNLETNRYFVPGIE